MSSNLNQHVVPYDNPWAVRGQGNSKVTSVGQTQAEAIVAASTIAKIQKSELIIHGRDGKIYDKDSYGYDPCLPKNKIY